MKNTHRLTPEELSTKYRLQEDRGITIAQIEKAYKNFDEQKAILLGFSGKIAAGKDTVAPKTFSLLNEKAPQTDSFATELKKELTGIIETIAGNRDSESSAKTIAQEYNVTENEAAHLVSLIQDEISTGKLKTGYDRTAGCRLALQYWATEVRRKRDPLYWVKPVIARALLAAAEGKSTQLTDVRFLTEAWGIMNIGGLTVRLDVSEEEQRKRILQRDGFEVSEQAKNHSSETELDDFAHFSIRINSEDYSNAQDVAKTVYTTIKQS